jgi:cyclic pyranopterin phosphate synthase
MLIDGFGREVNYLRVSVTERCNFRCKYCMPEKPFSWVPKEDIVSFEDMFKFIKLSIDRGVNKIRITGGEPLLRDNLNTFIKMIFDYKNDIDLALTTNGYLLEEQAHALKEAGLKRVNISLDSLEDEVAKDIAQKSVLKQVLNGIEKSLELGLVVKINTVVIKDINDSEVISLLKYAKNRDISIRFIEFMDNNFATKSLVGLKSNEILEILASEFNFEKLPQDKYSPAQYYKLDDGYKFGIIEPYQDDFCKSCNRIRVSADGFLIPCLYFDEAKSIKEPLRKNDLKETEAILNDIILNKPEKNRWSKDSSEISTRAFYETGG